ncbi:MAG: hypothetical protein UY09_C0042G0003 [Parcubacteria group bacterium GW2011_GWA2_47_8]|nr:MAG: hypothetical protein UY09_C0042G0003 [Parcubacteria group bacterium GW2011_GWA2_47_8]
MPKNPAINQSKTQSLVTPPPVVVILGHIDHGKSTLLHKIREAKAPKEAGDITQHIGAYQALVSQKTGKKGQKANQLITFIDTPGHKAFDTVRTHGTSIADVAIVVVAADEGVEAQTKEVLALVQAAKLPYIIAVNKIDKPGANVQKIKQDLGQFNVYIEEWGGEVPLVEVSALKGTGIDQLLEMILLVYAMQERTVRVDGHAQGVVLTAGIDPKSGRYATLLVEEGTLNIRDTIYIKRNENRIRIMTDATGAPITQAGPSTPVFIRGIKEIPSPGDRFSTDKTATTTVTAAIATDAAAVSAEQSAVVGPARDPFAKETLAILQKAT